MELDPNVWVLMDSKFKKNSKPADLTIRMESLAKHRSEATVYLGRQPIYGANREIRAYELLYRRAAGDTTARFRDADRASAEVMLNAFLEIGLPTVSPLRPVFINHTRHLLTMDPILPADRCVIEVLEDVAADPETLAALRRLKSLNFRIALDDFVYSEETRPHDRTRRLREAGPAGAGYRTLSANSSPCCAPSTSALSPRKSNPRPSSDGAGNWAAASSRAITCAVRKCSRAAASPPIASRCSRFSASAPTWKAPPT